MAKIINIASWSLARNKILNMENQNRSDRIFREKLGEYNSTPPMHIWDKIDKKRTPLHRAKLWMLRNWGVALLTSLIIASVGFYFSHQGDPQLETTAIALKDTQTEHQEKQQLINKEALLNANTKSTSSNIEESQYTEGKALKSQNQRSAAKVNSGLSVFLKENENKESVSKKETENKNELANSLNTEEKPEPTIIQNHISENDNIQQTRSPLFDLEKDAIGSISKIPQKQLLIDTPFPEFPFDPEKGCPKIEKKGNFDIYLDAVIGPDMLVRSLQPKTPDNIKYLQAREASESFRYAFSSGLRLSMVSKRGFAFRTGLVYAQINEKFDFIEENVLEVIIKTTTDPITGEIIKIDTTYENGDRHHISYNRFHMLDIPLIAGFEVTSEKWTYSVNAGANINLLFRQKGELLSDSLRPVSITSSDSNAYPAFRNSLGVSIYGSIGLNYKFTESLRLIVEPNFRYYLNPFSKSSYSLNQEYFSIGVLTGLRVKF